MIRPALIVLSASLCSCGLIKAPFRVVGGVTQGTAQVIRKPIDAHKERKAKKEREKAKEEAKKEQAEAAKRRTDHLPPDLLPPANDGNPDLESIEPDLPPLPSEYASPAVGDE